MSLPRRFFVGLLASCFSLLLPHFLVAQHVLGFRVDFFNIFNIASYGNPDNTINDSSWGLISTVRSPARQIQLSLHYLF